MTADAATATAEANEITSHGGGDTAFPPPLVAETLQYRLDTGNIAKQGGQRGSLTRCAQKFGIFQSNLLAKVPDAETIEASKQDLCQDLEMFELEMYKLILLQRNLDAQVEINHKAQQHDRQAEIEKWSEEVRSSQSEAGRAQEMKRCFQEYEALAKLTNENHPHSTRALKEEVSKIVAEIEQLKAEEAKTNHLMKVREGQFQLLIQYMLDLKRSLNDTEEQATLEELAKKAPREVDKEDAAQDRANDSAMNKAEAMDVDDEEEEGLYENL